MSNRNSDSGAIYSSTADGGGGALTRGHTSDFMFCARCQRGTSGASLGRNKFVSCCPGIANVKP
jgi:hypothetical protein